MSEQRSSSGVWWVVGIIAALLLLLLLCMACACAGLLVFRTNATTNTQYYGPAPERVVTVPAIPVPERDRQVVPEFRPETGALVLLVEPGSPADALGLQAGDIIITVNGRDLGPNLTLRQALQRFQAGDTVNVTWWIRSTRDVRTGTVQLGEDPGGTGGPYLGIEYRTLP